MPKKLTTKVLPEINWKTKFKQYYKVPHSNDVSITLTDGSKALKKGHKILSLIIRDNLWKQFESDYVVFGIFKNRIYFRPTDKTEGYALVTKNTNGYIKCTLRPGTIEQYEAFIGDYSLRYDEYYELYYIEVESENLDD